MKESRRSGREGVWGSGIPGGTTGPKAPLCEEDRGLRLVG